MIHSDQVVFVVHGDAGIREGLQELLTLNGLHALTFESAAAYLACPMPDLPGCLILDVDLPDRNGLDLLQEIAGESAPVIFVTRRADIASSVRAIKAGAFDFLTIPCKAEQFLRAVHSAIHCDLSSRPERVRINELRERSARLTPRQREVFALIVSGMLNKQVAAELGISEVTVQIHRRRVMEKMEASSFADLVRLADTLQIPLSPSLRVARIFRGAGDADLADAILGVHVPAKSLRLGRWAGGV